MANLESRKQKTQVTTMSINSIASTDILKRIETKVLIEFHDKITIPGLIANSESWNLNKGESTELEKIEFQAIKHLFDLPLHISNTALIYSFGLLYTTYKVEKRRLTYLHRILKRYDAHWTKVTLDILYEMNIGWAKSIRKSLHELNLPTDFSDIKSYSINAWKKRVHESIEIKNKSRLQEECYKKTEGIKTKKSKTAHIVDDIESDKYSRSPKTELLQCSRQETKTLLIARFGMLECGKNFKGTMSLDCKTCKKIDDENHRLNHCKKIREINLYDSAHKVDFQDVYSNNLTTIKTIISHIDRLWNTRNSHGTMIK